MGISNKKNLIFIGLFIFILFLFIFAIYRGQVKVITANRFIDDKDKKVLFGSYSLSSGGDIIKISGQLHKVVQEGNQIILEVLFEDLDNKVYAQKFKLGGDINNPYFFIHKQEDLKYYPVGNISYEKINTSSALEILSDYKGPISFLINIGDQIYIDDNTFSQNLISNSITCNKKFLDSLKNDKLTIDCTPLVFQINIIK